jgi:hypothetical protein
MERIGLKHHQNASRNSNFAVLFWRSRVQPRPGGKISTVQYCFPQSLHANAGMRQIELELLPYIPFPILSVLV